MKISVAMAAYNGEKYIAAQLNSICNQTRKVDEIIIVDDCSTDNTVSVVNQYIKDNKSGECIRLFTNDRNMGFVGAFKSALCKTTGDIVFICDQDDEWREDKVASMVDIMAKNNKILLLASTFSGMDGNGNAISMRTPFFTENHGLILFCHYKRDGLVRIGSSRIGERNISMGCTMSVRRELVNQYIAAYDGKYSIPHDWELCFRAASQDGLYFINTPYIRYRIHENNTIGVKTKNEQLGVRYRIDEYTHYTHAYKEFIRMMEREHGIRSGRPDGQDLSKQAARRAKKQVKKQIKKQKTILKFYKSRIMALKKRSVWGLVKTGIVYTFRLGIAKSAFVAMDILALLQK